MSVPCSFSRRPGYCRWLLSAVLLASLSGKAVADNLLYNASGQLQTVVASGAATGAPVIIGQPASSVLETGLPLALAVNATGNGLSYQWKKDTVDIPGATRSTLVFPSITAVDVGSYIVVVTNSAGSVPSNPAVLSLPVSPLLPFTTVSGGANWTQGGTTIWHMYTDADHTHGGVPAIGSGSAFEDDSYVEATYTVSQPSTLTYWSRVPGGDDPGYWLNNNHPVLVNVTVNGIVAQKLTDGSSVTQWTRHQLHLGKAGTYVIRWNHLKNGYVLLGDFSVNPAPDTDLDGLSDDWENEFFHTLAYGPDDDPDTDGNNNLIELKDGTNPTQYYEHIVHANVVLQGHGHVVVSPPEPVGGYPYNTTITLTAVPDPGYVFVTWDEYYLKGNISPVSFTLYGESLNIKAFFEPETPLAIGADTTGLTWTTGGDAPWISQTHFSHDGVDALESGSLPEGTARYTSWVQTTITGPAQLSYDLYRSSYGGRSLQCSVDGLNVTLPLSTFNAWVSNTVFLPPGTHVVRWTHVQDHTSYSSWSTSFLDKVVVTPTTDTDHDNLADEWEMKYFHSLDSNATDDNDTDLVSNLQEYQEFSDPTGYYSHRVRIPVTTIGNGSYISDPAESSYLNNEDVTLTAVPDPGWVLQSWKRAGGGEMGNPFLLFTNQADIPMTLHFEPATGVNDALDNSTLTFTNSSPGWYKTTTVTHDGVDALQSPTTLQSTVSPMTTTVTGPKVLSFWWKFDLWYDGALTFQDNALPKVVNDGSSKGWQRVFVKLGPGQHTLTWSFTGTGYGTGESNLSKAWIDQVLIGDDSDQDGLPDDWEMANFHNLDQTADGDADSDNVSNQTEWADATDPQSAGSALYHLNVAGDGPGSVVLSPAQDLYAAGTQVTLTADPAFTGWSGDATGSANPLVVTMNNHKNITANFGPLSRGVDNTKLVFTTDATHPWVRETQYGGLDNDTASSDPNLPLGQESWMETTFTTAGRLSFDVMPYYAYNGSTAEGGIRWSIDGVEAGRYTSSTQISFVLPAGSHTVRWTYKQIANLTDYYHIAMLDNMVWTPIANAIPLDVALDTTGLTWTSDTPAVDWLGRATVTHDGVDAAETLPVAGGGQAVLQTVINPTTQVVVSFWWKVSSEQYFDMLHFYKDGEETGAISAISGEQDWTKITFALPAGSHTLRWVYKKDYSGEHGQDKAWVDQLTITPVVASTLVDALDSPGQGWTTSSGAPWTGSSAVTHDGGSAAASPPIADGQTTWIQTSVTGPGTLTFWWKISSVEFWNPMSLYIDGYDTGRYIDGETDWTEVTVPIIAGTHTIRWSYAKDSRIDTTGDQDGAWVDQVVFSPTGGGTPDISVEQPAGNLLTDGATSAYGGVAMTGHGYKIFTIRNAGNGSLTGLNVTFNGTNAGDFSLLSTPAATIAPGGSTQFIVDFAPGALGARTAALHIASNDPDENPYDVSLTGSGVAPPDIVVEQPAGTDLVDGMSTIGFGSVNTGAASTLTFTMKNKGAGALSALAYNVDGANALDFTITHPAAVSLAVNGTLTFTVKFSPVGAGSRQAALHILSSDPDEGSFDIALTGTGVLAKPAISQPPASLLSGTGESATFTVGAVGSGALTYKWLKNAKAITGATASTYTIPAVALTDSGSFTATATSSLGSATSGAAVLGVVSRVPSMVTVNEGTTLTLKAVTSIPAGPVVIYQWTKDGLPVNNGTVGTQVTTGATTASLSITKAVSGTAGNYICVVAMAGMVKTTGAFSVDVRLKPYVYGPSGLAWAVSGTVNTTFYAQNNPTAFIFTGLPAGVTGTTTTINSQVYGVLSGKPSLPITTAKTFTVTASNAAGASTPMTVSYTVAALPTAAVGTFNGLVDRDTTLSAPVVTPAGQKLLGHGGSLTLAVTATGALTGSVKVEDKSYTLPATARLNASVGGNPSASVVIVRGTGIASLTLAFTIDRTTGHLTGTLTDGLVATPVVVEGWKQTAPAAAMTGSYTAALVLDPALTGTGTTAANVAYPQGGGYLTLTLSAAGVATWGGKLADGTAITGSSSIGSALDLPFHQFLYTPTVAATAGAAHGWLKLSTDSVASRVNEGRTLLDGTIDWNKKLQTAVTRVYKGGFNLHNLTVSGGKYAAPLANKIVLNLLDKADNARFTFSEGGLSGPAPIVGSVAVSGLNKPFRITKTNTLVLPAAALNPAALTLKLTAGSGAFSGGFSLKNDPDPTKPGTLLTRPVTFDGILIPRLGQGVGWFLLPELPATGTPNTTLTTSPQLSGKVVIDATQ